MEYCVHVMDDGCAGKRVRPERSSATFASLTGSLDPRVDLDKNIKHEDPKYKPLLAIMASKLSYENENFTRAAVTHHWNVSLYL